ncbi:T9SS type A sorting domain-containing protein [Flavobacterium sp. M31R6]|uniref:T9SS type A sorting domain-containing protein n=1 Tax=Flavobacterium sp. M31R6 TaxID=2739062 RepID=UPI00156A4097|nr:T9SS type A sorting domain-containing protein [Flavobacterium sp. M31R6]QKJ61913.1 T9SS type A sorting domain-containing protein [Flavobacterium sp. M31R6]
MKTKLLILLFLASLSTYAQTNLVPNGGFETWTNSTTLSNWTIENSVTQNTSSYIEGSKSAQLSIANSTTKPKITALVPMTAGTTYTVKFKYKYVTGNYSGQHPISLNISQNGSATTLSSSTFATDNNWTVKETTFTPDQNLSYDLSISLYTFDAAAFNVLIDDVQVYVQGTEQYTTIPDVNFENKLIAMGIDYGAADGKVLTNSINKLTSLNISSSTISDLTGIQDFVALKILHCDNNKLTSLDVSKNVTLTELYCYSNKLTSLDVSKNVALTVLICRANSIPTLDITKNIQLQSLDIALYAYGTMGGGPTGKFTSIDLSQNTGLTSFICDNNPITTLDLSKNLALTYLSCATTKLTAIDLSKNVNLKSLNCQSNSISNLDITNNIALTELICRGTLLSTIDVTKNIALKYLEIAHYLSFTSGSEMGKITSIDLSQNIALTRFICDNNPITVLDLTKNVNLTSLSCRSNFLNSLNLKNGKNTLLTSIDLSLNPNLRCITVDDVSYSNNNWANKKDSFAFYSPFVCSTITKIPDAKFEDKLIALGIDTDGKNGIVLNSSIAAITSLDVSNSSIGDLTGIQAFTALTTLNCSGNLLKKVDVSKNTVIATLNCINNPNLICIQVADIAAAANWATTKDTTASFSLDCTIFTLIPNAKFEDKLIALGIDRDGKNGKVATESIASLTSLDVSYSSIADLTGIQDFVALKTLNCDYNELTSLDVTKNKALTNLYPSRNQLTTLDVSQNLALVNLQCWNNQITSLDVSKNIDLTSLGCSTNKLTTLDISKNVALTYFNCYSNRLTNLNLKNGKNTLLNDITLSSNPDLRCIAVDDVSYSNTNWANKKDTTAFYSAYDCSTITAIPDAKFEDKLIASGIDTDGKNGFVLNSSIASISTLDVSNGSIANLKGIEGFTALTTLNCSGNLFVKIDLSKNASITTLNCSNNPTLVCIQVADVTAASNWATTKDATANFSLDCTIYTLIPDSKFEDKLIALEIDKDGKNGKVTTESISKLTSLDVSNSSIADLTGIQDFVALKTLNCYNNKLTSLDISKNVALTYLYCYYNQLTTLDVTKNSSLTVLECYSNKLPEINVSNNTLLQKLDCSANLMSSLDVTKNTALEYLSISYFPKNTGASGKGKFESIDVSKNIALKTLYCQQNKIKVLDVSKNINLEYLKCSENYITDLNVSNNISLGNLECDVNLLTNIDVSNNNLLNYLSCDSNKLTRLDVSKNLQLNILGCRANQLRDLDLSKHTKLSQLFCDYNQLKSLNLKNGNNLKLGYSNFQNNPYLSCIEVDDITFSNSNWKNYKDSSANYSNNCANSTLIPDPKFEDKLIALGIDTDGKNGKVLTANITTLTSLDVSNVGISDLTGIEDFTSLQSLSCNNNELTKLNLSYNHNLESLNVAFNKLSMLNLVYNTKLQLIHCNDNLFRTLDFSKNTNLTEIYCPNNKLVSLNLKNGNNTVNNGPSIKNFTNNPDLNCIQVDDVNYSNTNWSFYKDATASYSFDCAYSTAIPDAMFEDKLIALGIDTDGKNGKVLTGSIASVSSLDVSSSSITDLTGIQDFVSLTTLKCNNNQLTALDVSKNLALITLNCYANQLTSVDVSKNLALVNLYISNNKLTILDVSKNTVLTTLSCQTNKLTFLDVSKNVALIIMQCHSNNLLALNLKNGKNTLIDKSTLSLYNNPNLYCILVDDVAYSNTNWATNKDATASFNSVECKALSLPVNNFNVESKGETCLNSNNGEINITATATFGYKAKINAGSYSFTNNSLKVPNLTPGTYTISITIPNETFEQSFTVIIPKGATITGKSSVAANKVSVEITEGTAPYTVFVDGVEQFETTDSNFTVDTKKGGLLQVKTAKACEGIYAKDIARLDGAISAYPNPTSGSFEIELPTAKKEVVITLYTLDGQMISTKTYTVENGKAQLSLENQATGIYVAKIELDTPDYLKIIKN